jgi:hypothetical protein
MLLPAAVCWLRSSAWPVRRHWAAICRVAAMLRERAELSGDEVDWLIAEAPVAAGHCFVGQWRRQWRGLGELIEYSGDSLLLRDDRTKMEEIGAASIGCRMTLTLAECREDGRTIPLLGHGQVGAFAAQKCYRSDVDANFSD